MIRSKSIFNTILINFIFLSAGLLAIELICRVKYYAKIDLSKPIITAVNVSNAILNNKSWTHLDQGNLVRKPYPYLMFKGAPNKLDHNELGFRISEPINRSTINIAFWGGSTGYSGNPPIINLLTNKLNKNTEKVKYSPINFSVISSNHNQHLHSLVENSNTYPIDLVIFYGGYNETLQTSFYDPRPGYPYNFYKRNELSPEKMLIAKHFVLFKVFEKFFPSDSKKKVWSKEWSKEIVNNYSDTINKARQMSQVLTTGRCKVPFIFIYQPFNMDEKDGVDKEFRYRVNRPLSELAENSNDGINLSKVFQGNKSFYTDIVHLNQKGKELISNKIINSNKFKKSISSCSLN